MGGNFNIGSLDEVIHVVVNAAGARVTCRFTDTSGVFEDNAEVGYTDNCNLVTADGTWTDGTGRVTAAANNAPDGSDGGNVTIVCRFDAGDFTPV